jgi:hypothetical protein
MARKYFSQMQSLGVRSGINLNMVTATALRETLRRSFKAASGKGEPTDSVVTKIQKASASGIGVDLSLLFFGTNERLLAANCSHSNYPHMFRLNPQARLFAASAPHVVCRAGVFTPCFLVMGDELNEKINSTLGPSQSKPKWIRVL